MTKKFCVLMALWLSAISQSITKADEGANETKSTEPQLHVRKFNETCDHESDCIDFRLRCIKDDIGDNRCLCVRFHRWDIYSQQCVVAENMTEMLAQLIEQYDAQSDEAEDANRVYTGMVVAGFMVLGVGCIMAGVCTFIACYRPKSEEDLSSLDKVRSQRAAPVAGTSRSM